MAKQLNVSLNFSANTETAKRQLQELQTSLTSLVNNTKLTKGMDLNQALKIDDAITATAELKSHLQAATNVQTGNLDFSKLSDSLRKSGKSLSEYGQQLKQLGPEGQRAFQSLATSVISAEMPLKRSNALLNEMWVSLKNTARWQISSSILHGFMGTIQSAYGYAQDLNESLNNIRIVTGYSVDEMSQFAKEANKAAKQLSTTTTQYTDASLIFYQQGLSTEEVKARTEVTIKMANAAGQSAQTVSDQLTAVWNNFYDGTKSLEYYADVMTALGAATASSTDEIAGGLEKFAAIGDTIGLSFEYAASALATITSNTRQSEEVVGTALKTIFARIQGLKLGETLDDGTTLNKYSEALNTVGISIFDTSGELKAMDNILDEMAAKWDTLSKAEQAALSQTVAGVRQYTQLIALMENWDNGDNDSMMANLNTSYNSTGALQQQADIYAEGWEAARDRVQAAAQGIYDDLLNDEAFIDILNSLEKILTFTDKLIDSIGGLSGVFTVLGTIITRVFHQQLAAGLENAAYNIKMLSSKGRENLKQERASFIHDAANSTENPDYSTRVDKARSSALEENLKLQSQLMDGAERMTQIELETNKALIERARIQGENHIKAAQDLQTKEDQVKELSFEGRTQVISKAQKEGLDVGKQTKKYIDTKDRLKTGLELKTNLPNELKKMSKEGKSSTEILTKLQKAAQKLGDEELTDLIASLKESDVQGDNLEQTLARVVATINGANDVNLGALTDLGVKEETLDGLTNGFVDAAESERVFTESSLEVTRANEAATHSMEKSKGATLSWADHLVGAANMAMGVASAIQSLSSIIDTVQNPDMTGWEKFSSILMSITMIVPMLAMAFNKESIASLAAMSAAIAHAFGLETEATAAMGAAAATGTFAGSVWTLLWPIGLAILVIGALVGAVVGLIAVFKMLEAASPAGQLAAAKENAAAAAEALEEANTAAKELKTTIEGYDSAVDKLKTVAYNTDEFTAALEEANTQARTLIDTYDLLAGKDYSFNTTTGLIEFKDGVLEGLEDKANQRVTDATINSMAAKNDVLSAENKVEFEKMSTEHDQGYLDKIITRAGEAGAASMLLTFGAGVIDPATLLTAGLAGLTVGSHVGLGEAIYEDVHSSYQEDALARLNDLYVAHNSNFIAAYNDLSAADKQLIDALGYTDAELQGLIAATADNTKAILENNKQIVDKNFEDNEIYNTSANKEYLNEVLAEDLQTKKDAIMDSYDKDGTHGWESTDDVDSNKNTEKVEQYVEEVLGLSGYGITEFTGTRIDTGAVKITTADGETKELSANQIMQYAAEKEALGELNSNMSQYSQAVNRLKVEEAKLADQFAAGQLTYEEYVEAVNTAMEAEIKAGTLTENQITSYITQHGENQRGASANAVKTTLQSKGFVSELASDFEQQFLEIYKDYSDEEIQLAVQVAADATSLQDFMWDFERAVGQATIDGLKESQSEVSDILASGIASGEISKANLELLESNSDFKAYLEEQNILLEDFSNQAYEKQVEILTGYSDYLHDLREEAIETQKAIIGAQMAATVQEASDARDIVADDKLDSDEKAGMTDQQIKLYEDAIKLRKEYAEALATINDKNSSESDIKKAKQEIAELEKEWEETIGDGLPLSIDDSDLGPAWDSIVALEEELLALDSIDVKLEFANDMVESLEDMIEAQSTFEKAVHDDMEKVNGSYQMTIQTARKWREIYPDLFKQASVTADGLIAINAAVVDNQLAGSDAIRAATAQQAIDAINADIEELKAEREKVAKSLELAKAMKDGTYKLEEMSVEDLALLRRSQTEYFMKLGYDEQVATQMALASMGTSQEEYAQLVANASVKSAEKTIEANEAIQTKLQLIIANLKALWSGLFNGLRGSLDALIRWIKGEGSVSEIGSVFQEYWQEALNTVDNNKILYEESLNSDLGFDGTTITVDGEKYEITAEMQVGAHSNYEEALQEELDNIDKAIEDLEWSKIELEALSKISGEDWGEDLDDYKDDDKSKDKEKKDLLELAERYHELTREVEALEHQLELVSKEKDRAFGAKKLQAIEKEIKAMEDLVATQQDLYKAQLVFLALDQQKVSQTFGNAEFKDNGEIANYSTLVAQAAGELNAARNTYNNSAQEDADKDALEAAEKRYEDQIKVLEQYEETIDKTRESEKTLEEAYDRWQAAHFDKFSYKLELEIELNEDDLQRLDYYLSKTEDDFYSRGESLALMADKVGIYTDSLGANKIAYAELEALKAAGKINDEQYIEGLDSISDGLYDNLEALLELDKEMMSYYGDTLTMAQEEIEKTTSQLEKQTAILDHYMTIIDLMGKSTDYTKVGIVLEGKAETTKNEMIAARKEYDLFAKEAEENYLKWQSAGTAEQAELYKKQYEASLAAADEAQEKYLSKAEAYGEALKAILENSLNKYAQELENALTGGTSFDQMTTAMERAASLQEEYLTTTNKIYETNKLINQAQQEIDKSSNSVAKQRLKQFIDETNQLQSKNKLSQYELEIQQAKYELLLAEIALEEAQSAKSQVRLQRDAEGNFGYVYTADQEQVNNAAQELADAQNQLYNIALDGANDYAEKYQQTLNEMYDTLRSLHEQYLNGEFESEEEYQNAVLEAKKYYFDLLEQYSDLYTIAISTDARALEDSWSREFNSMIYNTDNWRQKVEEYVQNVNDAFKRWDEEMDDIAGEVGLGGDLSDLSSAVESVDKESQELLSTLTKPNGVLDTLQAEIDAVSAVTDVYAVQRVEIQNLTKEYEALATAILEKKKAEALKIDSTPPAPSGDSGSGSSGGGGSSSGGDKGTSSPTGGGGDGKVSIGDKVRLKNTGTTYYYDSYGTAPRGNRGKAGDEVIVENVVNGGQGTSKQPYGVAVKSSNSAYGWLKIDDITGYASGGYTGQWGSYGKLAMLHEKELILNERDTENFLSSMELLNNIVQAIDLHAANSQFGAWLNSPGMVNIGNQDALEQMVTIEANFPNVSSRTEIEEAFTTLVNRASQYANRKQ